MRCTRCIGKRANSAVSIGNTPEYYNTFSSLKYESMQFTP